MSNLSYYEMRLEMCKVAKMMWDRRLTNAAGGNFAVRVDENRILISPSLMSERKHCEMQPEDFLLIDYDRNIIEGEGQTFPRKSDACTDLTELQRDRVYNPCTSVLLYAIRCSVQTDSERNRSYYGTWRSRMYRMDKSLL